MGSCPLSGEMLWHFPFLFVSFPISLVLLFKLLLWALLNKNGVRGINISLQLLEEMPVSVMLAICLLYVSFIMVTYGPSIHGLFGIVTMNSVDLCQRLSCLDQNEHAVFIHKSV